MFGNAYSPFLGPGSGTIETPVGPVQVEGPGGVRETEGDVAAQGVYLAANAAIRQSWYGADSPEARHAVAQANSVLGMAGGGGGGEFGGGAGGSGGGLGLVLILAAAAFILWK